MGFQRSAGRGEGGNTLLPPARDRDPTKIHNQSLFFHHNSNHFSTHKPFSQHRSEDLTKKVQGEVLQREEEKKIPNLQKAKGAAIVMGGPASKECDGEATEKTYELGQSPPATS